MTSAKTRFNAEWNVAVGEALFTGLPRLGAPIRVANTTIESDSMMHCVRPAMMEGSAAGSSTFHKSWRFVAPKAFAGFKHGFWDRGEPR